MLELIFVTSNPIKIAHAKHLSYAYAINITKQKNYGVGYTEPRIHDRDELIRRSVEDAIERFQKNVSNYDNKLFFIEDTSVIIDVLSEHEEVPGVDIKYWMRENTFESVDKLLKEKGNNRKAKVRSDVILVLNRKLSELIGKKYLVFTSEVSGSITPVEFNVKTQPLYPWLNDNTFNKWFIPDGCDKPLSLLDIQKANKHDFRAGAYNDMLSFLYEKKLIVKREEYKKIIAKQLNLFEPICFIICGPTCAGKTTLAEYLNEKYNYYHLEASDFMYLSYYQTHGIDSGVNIGDFAEKALIDNPYIVTNQIIEHIKKFNNVPIIVTGFRNPEEIEGFKKLYRGGLNIEVIYVDASGIIRYERSVNRQRQDSVKTIDAFNEKDAQQLRMGLLKIKKNNSKTILNEKTLQNYFSEFKKDFHKELETTKNDYNKGKLGFIKNKQLQNAIIESLYKSENIEEYHTTTEIAHLIRDNPEYSSRPKNKNNISRYFNQNYYPYYEIAYKGHHLGYRLSQTGRSYAKFFLLP